MRIFKCSLPNYTNMLTDVRKWTSDDISSKRNTHIDKLYIAVQTPSIHGEMADHH